MQLGSRGTFALVILVGVAGTGVAVRLLNVAGFGTLGSLVWALGYGTTIFVLWYGWVRPLDLTGGTDPEEIADATTEPSDGDRETPDR